MTRPVLARNGAGTGIQDQDGTGGVPANSNKNATWESVDKVHDSESEFDVPKTANSCEKIKFQKELKSNKNSYERGKR